MSSRSTAAPRASACTPSSSGKLAQPVPRDRAEMGAGAVEQRRHRPVPRRDAERRARRSSGRGLNVDSCTEQQAQRRRGCQDPRRSSSPKRGETTSTSPGSSMRPCRPRFRRGPGRSEVSPHELQPQRLGELEGVVVGGESRDRPQKEIPPDRGADRDVASILGEQTDGGEDVLERRAAVPDAACARGRPRRRRRWRPAAAPTARSGRRLPPGPTVSPGFGEQRDGEQASGTRPQRRQGQCRLAPGQPEAERGSQA